MAQQRARRDDIICAVFFTVLFAAGLMIVALIGRDYAMARASVHWPQQQAVILEQNGRSLRFAYSVNGHNYQSYQHRFYTSRRAVSSGIDASAPFVTAYIHPNKPEIATLVSGASLGVFLAWLCGGFLCMFLGAGGMARSTGLAFGFGAMTTGETAGGDGAASLHDNGVISRG